MQTEQCACDSGGFIMGGNAGKATLDVLAAFAQDQCDVEAQWPAHLPDTLPPQPALRVPALISEHATARTTFNRSCPALRTSGHHCCPPSGGGGGGVQFQEHSEIGECGNSWSSLKAKYQFIKFS